ncbi:hypothetical protein CLU81_3561 [Flavobacterium sp. 9]|uniref:hypothetical protein n=1 Tax=Flavobacterium sp. 9 TaxID=2035198 RepID=UPI000C19C334|nr:hypothetical protein [Flavobacterium sp. 9]PIF32991.1 hypothetical protein CLU81_3561 [Flavobacterium sp. 9]
MIQTKRQIIQNRNGSLSKIKVEVRPDDRTETGRKFLVIDWNLDNTENAIFSKYVHWTNEQIDATELYIEDNYAADLVGLTREEREYKKLQIALLIDTQTNLYPDGKTIWGCEPEDWELTT